MKIIGNTVGTTTPKPNLMQTDPAKGDFVKGKEKFEEQLVSGVVKTVNGTAPDENGNVEIEVSGGGGTSFTTDKTLTLGADGVLRVNTTNDTEQDNTLPITSAGVYATVGNIEALLKTI